MTVHVTNHAQVRYLERIENRDIERAMQRCGTDDPYVIMQYYGRDVTGEILTPTAIQNIRRAAALDGRYQSGAEHDLILRDRTVVTVLPESWPLREGRRASLLLKAA